jgi:hypothetical protein
MTDEASPVTVGTGGLLLTEIAGRHRVQAHHHDHCRLVQAEIGEPWPAVDKTPHQIEALGSQLSRLPKFLRLYAGPDDRSHFRLFDDLFPAETGCWSERHPAERLRFVSMPDGFAAGWHTEPRVNMFVVLDGEVQLDTGERMEAFAPGEGGLSEDQHGKGHTSCARGLTHMLMITLPDGSYP